MTLNELTLLEPALFNGTILLFFYLPILQIEIFFLLPVWSKNF